MDNQEMQKARAAVAAALDAEDMNVEDFSPAGVSTANLKDLFCKNWETVKSVLQFISQFLPVLVRPVVTIIIKAGDVLHATICK